MYGYPQRKPDPFTNHFANNGIYMNRQGPRQPNPHFPRAGHAPPGMRRSNPQHPRARTPAYKPPPPGARGWSGRTGGYGGYDAFGQKIPPGYPGASAPDKRSKPKNAAPPRDQHRPSHLSSEEWAMYKRIRQQIAREEARKGQQPDRRHGGHNASNEEAQYEKMRNGARSRREVINRAVSQLEQVRKSFMLKLAEADEYRKVRQWADAKRMVGDALREWDHWAATRPGTWRSR